LATGLLRI